MQTWSRRTGRNDAGRRPTGRHLTAGMIELAEGLWGDYDEDLNDRGLFLVDPLLCPA